MTNSRALLSLLIAFTPVAVMAEGVPDFSGVYYPIAPFGRAAIGGPPQAPRHGKDRRRVRRLRLRCLTVHAGALRTRRC